MKKILAIQEAHIRASSTSKSFATQLGAWVAKPAPLQVQEYSLSLGYHGIVPNNPMYSLSIKKPDQSEIKIRFLLKENEDIRLIILKKESIKKYEAPDLQAALKNLVSHISKATWAQEDTTSIRLIHALLNCTTLSILTMTSPPIQTPATEVLPSDSTAVASPCLSGKQVCKWKTSNQNPFTISGYSIQIKLNLLAPVTNLQTTAYVLLITRPDAQASTNINFGMHENGKLSMPSGDSSRLSALLTHLCSPGFETRESRNPQLVRLIQEVLDPSSSAAAAVAMPITPGNNTPLISASAHKPRHGHLPIDSTVGDFSLVPITQNSQTTDSEFLAQVCQINQLDRMTDRNLTHLLSGELLDKTGDLFLLPPKLKTKGGSSSQKTFFLLEVKTNASSTGIVKRLVVQEPGKALHTVYIKAVKIGDNIVLQLTLTATPIVDILSKSIPSIEIPRSEIAGQNIPDLTSAQRLVSVFSPILADGIAKGDRYALLDKNQSPMKQGRGVCIFSKEEMLQALINGSNPFTREKIYGVAKVTIIN